MLKTQRIVIALAILLLSATLLSSSTFAWFTMNDKVTVSGMEVKAVSEAGVLIAPATGCGTPDMPESFLNYKNQLAFTPPRALLEPVSTVDGLNYYFTPDAGVTTEGEFVSGIFSDYEVKAFNEYYNTSGAVGYCDYVFALYATNAANTDQYVTINRLKLSYAGDRDEESAFRVAVLVQDADYAHAETDVRLVGIVGSEGSLYFTRDYQYVVRRDAEGVPAGVRWAYSAGEKTVWGNSAKAEEVTAWFDAESNGSNVTSRVSLGDEDEYISQIPYAVCANDLPLGMVQEYNSPLVIGTVEPGMLRYFKITIRLWIEGEDESCTSQMFASLTDVWGLDVGIRMEKTDARAVNLLEREAVANHYFGLAVGDFSEEEYSFGDKTYYRYIGYQAGKAVEIFSPDDVLDYNSYFYTLVENERKLMNIRYLTNIYDGSIVLGTTNTVPYTDMTLRIQNPDYDASVLGSERYISVAVYSYDVRGIGLLFSRDTVITKDTVFYRSTVDGTLRRSSYSIRFDEPSA